jgi:hypothetical protein
MESKFARFCKDFTQGVGFRFACLEEVIGILMEDLIVHKKGSL